MSGARWLAHHGPVCPMARFGHQAPQMVLSFMCAFALFSAAGCVQPAAPERIEADMGAATMPPGTQDWPRYEVVIPVGAWDPGYSGAWYELAQKEWMAPALIHWVNDDDIMHRMIVALRVDAPATTSAPEHGGATENGDGHAHDHGGHKQSGTQPLLAPSLGLAPGILEPVRLRGVGAVGPEHDHGASSGSSEHAHGDVAAIDIIVEPGADAYSILQDSGIYDVHCHPHPWMVDTWDVTSSDPLEWTVRVDELHRVGAATVDLALATNEEVDLRWTVQPSNLKRLVVHAVWDDTRDDVVEVEGSNEPDTVQIAVLDPLGTIVANATETARSGNTTLTVDLDPAAWPATVTAGTASEADARLASSRADDGTGQGIWTVRVKLVDARGLVVSEQPVDMDPFADGQQHVALEVIAMHETPSVVFGTPGPVRITISDWPLEGRSDA